MTKPAYTISEQQRRRSAAHPRTMISVLVTRPIDNVIPLL